MSTFTLYPSAYLSGMDATFYGETPYTTTPNTIRQYLADANDATYALRGSPPGYIVTQQVTFELPNPTIPADEFIARVEGFVRWSEGGSGGFVGAAPYLGATPPSSIPYVTTDGRSPSSPITSTPFVQNVSWNSVDADNCNLLWLEGSQEDLSFVRTHQVGARLKTIKRSTCTVVDKTTLIDVTPVISVPVTSTLDWESAEPVNSALRRVDVEMRIEQGGTVAESGILIATATDTFQLAATGTVTRLLTAAEAIPNGTYKVYARATRNRASGAALSDQIGAWSAAATLIVNVPLPTAPTLLTIEEEFGDSVTLTVTPIATTDYASPTVEVQRSIDGGATWTALRFGTNVPATFGTPTDITDVELPRDVDVVYRARVNAIYSGAATNSSNWVTSAAVNLTGGTWNLKAVEVPGLAFIEVPVIGEIIQELDEDVGVFRPLDRRLPVVVAGELTGYDGSLEIRLTEQWQWETLKALIEAQRVLLMQRPYGDQQYIRFVDKRSIGLWGTPTNPQRRVILKYVETGAP